MAQPQPTRTWLRLPSIARPVVVPEQTPTPTPSQPRPPVARPPITAPTQPQEPTPPAATAPSADAPAAPKSPPKPAPGGTASLPTSPIRTTAPSSSLPTSPVRPPAAVAPTTSSLPPSPPASRKSSLPTSPANKPMPTTSSVPTSPITRAVPTSTPAAGTMVARVPSPSPSTRTVKPTVQNTTPESPKPKPTAPLPSPLILPPAKLKSDSEIPLEVEQKTVLVQKTISPDKSKPKINGSTSGKDLIDTLKTSLKDLGTKEKIRPQPIKKLTSDSKNGGMRVITIAGENKGAYMEVIRSPDKNHVFEGTSHNLRESKIWGLSSSSSKAEEEEERNEKSNKGKTKNSIPMSTFMNSNVQGINSSIVYNSTCSHHDPGVHLALSRKAGGGRGGFHHGNQG